MALFGLGFWNFDLNFWSSLAVETWIFGWNFEAEKWLFLVWDFGKSLISKIVRWISKEDVPLKLGSPQPYF